MKRTAMLSALALALGLILPVASYSQEEAPKQKQDAPKAKAPQGDVIRGGPGDDVLVGGRGPDDIRGGSGDDVIRGGLGRDILEGGTGSDEIFADGRRSDRRPGRGDEDSGDSDSGSD